MSQLHPDYHRAGNRLVVASAVVVGLGLLAGVVGLFAVLFVLSVSDDVDLGSAGVWGADLAVGDCFTDPGDVAAGFVDVGPCDQVHDSEVVYVDEQYFADLHGPPTGQQLLDATQAVCVDALVAYTGQPYATSAFDVWAIGPVEGNWAEGDRALTCVGVVGVGEQSETSMRAPA